MNTKKYFSLIVLIATLLFHILNVDDEFNREKPISFELNHFYISIDSVSFEAFKNHPEILQTYFESDSGMPDFSPVTDSTGIIYLRGKTIYMELMGPDNRFGVLEGVTGIGFSEDTQLPLDPQWKVRIDSLFPGMGMEFEKNNYQIKGESINWFDTAYIPDSTTSIYTWYSRYNPEFLNAITDDTYSQYTRENYLKLTHSDGTIVQDITGLSLKLNPADYKRISRELNRIGTKQGNANEKENISRYTIGKVVVELYPASKSRLTEVSFQLAEIAECNYQVGAILLKCNKKRLTMQFSDSYI